MKIAWLCKQKYMNHDVIRDKYGRLYHLPNELARIGHEIDSYCLNYSCRSLALPHTEGSNKNHGLITWHSYPAGPLAINILRYFSRLTTSFKNNQTDILIGSSDCLHTILTWRISLSTGIPFVLDLYDNYESFGMSNIPGIKYGHRHAIKNAAGITTVSEALGNYITDSSPSTPTTTINSTISAGQFVNQDKKIARSILGLPNDAILIGTAGSLAADRGTDMLYGVLDLVQQQYPNTKLILAGPQHHNPPPEREDIIYLGELPHSKVASLFNSLDVAVICMKQNGFGNYAFPQKAYEILSCKVPVVAAAVGPLQELFKNYQNSLYDPEDIKDLCEKLVFQITHRPIVDLPIPTWEDQAKKFEQFLVEKVLCHN